MHIYYIYTIINMFCFLFFYKGKALELYQKNC